MPVDIENVKADIERLVAETVAGIEAKYPNVDALRQSAWEEGQQAGAVITLSWMQQWLRDRLAAKTKYEDTRALEEILTRVQDEMRRVQNGTIGDPTPAG